MPVSFHAIILPKTMEHSAQENAGFLETLEIMKDKEFVNALKGEVARDDCLPLEAALMV